VELFRQTIERNLLANLDPAELGLRFEPVREQALKAAEQSQDFGGLFIGFSFFLIAAALILMALLFQFGLEQRVTEIGTLLALGFTPKQVRRLFLGEGVALATAGGLIGLIGGVGYAWLMIRGLTTIWRDAIASSALGFHVTGHSLVIGAVASVAVSAAVIGFALRKQARRPARELLAGEVTDQSASNGGRNASGFPEKIRQAEDPQASFSTMWKRVSRPLANAGTIAWGALGIAAATVGWALASGETANAEVFFSAGSLLLISGIAFAALVFNRVERTERRFTVAVLGLRGCTRRRNRSLAVVGLLACGSFLIMAIGAFKLDANADAWKRSSGTGGFALMGESTMPVLKDLNTREGREFFGLDEQTLANVRVVPMRVRDGDEASCLNLNRAQKPRLLGVKPELLAQRGAFTFAKVAQPSRLNATDAGGTSVLRSPWMLLERGRAPADPQVKAEIRDAVEGVPTNEVAAIGDLSSILWAMGKKVGDTIEYVDERGQAFKVRIVGAVANSILQGSLLVDEAELVRRFPGEAGYRMFLVDAPSNRVSEVSAELSRALQNVGLELTPATRRLAQFNAVQNTYLNTFQVLGGLGLVLGTAGLGVVVLRNVLERRNEFGVLQAVGWRRRRLQRLVLGEHGVLLLLGLVVGMLAALVAVLPPLLSPAQELPVRSLLLTLGAVVSVGLLATWVATRAALRGQLLDALRNE
jgi:ABC-type antimicrobial peptide transport system permease subunit